MESDLNKINKKKGILFWITGLSGTGKTELSKLIKKFVVKNYGETIVISGDDVRDIFNIKKYNKKDRLKIGKKYTLLAKYITNQKINVIFAVVGLFDELRKFNKKNINNYVEIFIKSDFEKIIKYNKKPLYKKRNIGNIWGLHIKPQFPKKPNIVIENNFQISLKKLSRQLELKIKKLLN